jgi:hypothetical protein
MENIGSIVFDFVLLADRALYFHVKLQIWIALIDRGQTIIVSAGPTPVSAA